MKKHIIISLAIIILVGCASHPQNTTKSQSDALPTVRVATCPTYSPTFMNVMTLLHDKNIDPLATFSGTAYFSVPLSRAAEARKILSSVLADEKFKGLEIVK